MEYKHENFTIKSYNNTIEFSGKMELADYKKIKEFLRQAEKEITSMNMLLDLKRLNFSNSSGIRIIAVFILETQKTVDIFIDTTKNWQNVGITPLKKMKTSGMINIFGD